MVYTATLLLSLLSLSLYTTHLYFITTSGNARLFLSLTILPEVPTELNEMICWNILSKRNCSDLLTAKSYSELYASKPFTVHIVNVHVVTVHIVTVQILHVHVVTVHIVPEHIVHVHIVPEHIVPVYM